MKNWKRVIQNIDLILFKIIFFFFLLGIHSVRADEMSSEKYLFSFKTYKSTCLLRVNDLPAIDNTTNDSGTMSAGFNLTAFLENGKNDIELLMAPQYHKDPKTLYPDSSCEVIVTKDTETASTEIARFKLSVNEKGEITASESVNTANSSTVFEGYTQNEQDYGFYKVRGNLKIDSLPRWAWVNATPVTENDLPKIKLAYTDIWMMIKDRDIEGLKKISQISNQEMAFAEGATTGMMFISTDFPQHVIDKNLTPAPIEWGKFRIIKYRNGRLFRLAFGFFQNSPLKFQNSNGEGVFTYNPYFSIIDGKVTLVR
ncbi:IdsF [Pectobacterium polaris]|uniref:IdsF n=1 Tax=Pectobacterium polaris TaxID=2042057 RepID=A0AAW5GB50_9GAMM|nr:IdsF [Pectobacterium polaris]MCL6350712.1 IdsF [Pectobacterium polaris]MCL6368110.1 IdsF [Pectobacterium polaris]UAY93938.1 IdsF [Pectobacterium polaris]